MEKKVGEEENKGLLKRLKEGMDDKEEQLAILSTFVRLGILVWSGGILTLAYIQTTTCIRNSRTKAGSDLHSQRVYWGFSYFRGPDSEEE